MGVQVEKNNFDLLFETGDQTQISYGVKNIQTSPG